MGRATEKSKLKSQINDITKRRQGSAAQLGASLYDMTRNDLALRSGRGALYDDIAACDAKREACRAKIEEIEAASQAAAVAFATFMCVVCGSSMRGDDLFCSGCGSPAAQAHPVSAPVPATSAAKSCATCGAPMAADDMFCMNCGSRVDAAVAGGE